MHSHSYDEILYIVEGEITEISNTNRLIAAPYSDRVRKRRIRKPVIGMTTDIVQDGQNGLPIAHGLCPSLGELLLALDLPLVGVGDGERQLARQQVVARVAVGDLDDVAALAQVVYVVPENHFHVLVLL
jgi:hypothetical protein